MVRRMKLPRWRCLKCKAEFDCPTVPKYCHNCEDYYSAITGEKSRIVCIDAAGVNLPALSTLY